MKVTVIGGGGRVGACAAFALQCGGLVSEIQLLDANQATAQGEALDLLHAGRINSAAPIIALQWLELNWPKLLARWGVPSA